ncbi:MAG: sugar transferase [Oscillospiraceae bacterium]|jgi:lipopolysaccharide/colanic/teichoic acid biosynthesis glycosyltransferase|nr:sugar transferase [Oscillospiraceae bacterium]
MAPSINPGALLWRADRREQLALKRGFDLLCAALGLVVLCPVLLCAAAAVRFSGPGPVFYRQTRIGRDGRPFAILKFRTMVADADRLGLPITVGRDPRITAVGAFLRRSKLDELPQLLNVLRGDMSLVGPRPEVPKYVARYTDAQRRVLWVRPGITDPASIQYRDENTLLANFDDPEEAYVRQVLPAKLAMNLAYLQNFSFWGDLGLLFGTALRLARDAAGNTRKQL